MSIESIRPGVWMAVLMLAALALAFGGTAWAYARRPAWAELPVAPTAFPLRGWHAAVYAGVFVAVLAVGLRQVMPAWWMQNDEERDAIISALCALGRGCPVVGNEMNRLRIPLGPLNRYLMTVCWLITPDPRFILGAVLTLHAAASAWLARTVDALVGMPAGVVAGVLLGTNPVLLEVCVQPSNGSWITLFLVGMLWSITRWARGDGGVPFVAAVAFFVCAAQLHGTAFVFVPVLALTWWIWRPRTPRRAVFAALALVFVVLLPWLRFQFETDWSVLRVASLRWSTTATGTGNGGDAEGPLGRLGLAVLGLLTPLFELGPAAFVLLVAGVAPLARAEPDASLRASRRAALLFLGVPLGAVLAGAALASGNWANRYNVPFIPGASLVAGAAMVWVARRSRVVAWAAALGVSAFTAMWSAHHAGGVLSAAAHGHDDMFLSENIAAVRALAARGYRMQDIETRVHGYAWNRWNGSQIYLAYWLMGPRRGPSPAEHVLVSACPVPAGFARWRTVLPPARGDRHALTGYVPALGPAQLEFTFGETVWSYTPGLPFYFQQSNPGDGQLRARLDRSLAYPDAYTILPTLRNEARDAPMRARVRTTLAVGDADRALTLLAPDDASPRVTVRGVTLAPLGHTRSGQDGRWWYVVPASLRVGDAAPVEVSLELSPQSMFPWRIDLYEDPTPECHL